MSEPGDGQDFKPYIAADRDVPEFTLKAVLLGSAFGIIFGAATVYLALRAGLTVSASVPIAVSAPASVGPASAPEPARASAPTAEGTDRRSEAGPSRSPTPGRRTCRPRTSRP